jgi:hypothetical protein
LLARKLTKRKVSVLGCWKIVSNNTRTATHTGKSQGAAISVEDAIIILKGLNLYGAHWHLSTKIVTKCHCNSTSNITKRKMNVTYKC